jgi:hypothetical protein
LFGRHRPFEKSRPQSLLIFLTSSAPKSAAMATICLTSSRLPAAGSQLLDPRKRHLPLEEIETAPSVFGDPDMAGMLLTSSQLRAPSWSAIQPTSLASPTSALALRKNSLVTSPRRKTPYITVGRTDADKLWAGLARPWPTGQVAARTPACHARGVTGQTASFIRLFDRHCSFETLRPQPLLIILTSTAPKRATMATICLTSSCLPAASSQLLLPRKRHLPSEKAETAPSVFGVPDIAAMFLTSSQLRAPSGSAIQPGSYDSLTAALAPRKISLDPLPRRKTPYIAVGRTCA